MNVTLRPKFKGMKIFGVVEKKVGGKYYDFAHNRLFMFQGKITYIIPWSQVTTKMTLK